MRISRKLAGAASLIAIASAFTFAQPSNANDLVNFFQNTLGVNATNLRNPQAFARTHFDGKRSALDAKIAYDLSSGRITAAQAASLRTELASIMNLEFAFEADGNLTLSEARTLSDKLSALDNRVDTLVATAGSGWVRDSRFGDSCNNQVGNNFDNRFQDGYDFRTGSNFDSTFDYRFGNRFVGRRVNVALRQVRDNISQLQTKVENGRTQRLLSINEYNLFKDRLAQQDRKCEQMAKSNNRFDQREFDRMTDSLNKLDSLITSALSTRPYPTAYGHRFGDFNRQWN